MENALKQAFNVIIEKRVEGAAFTKFKKTPEYSETEKRIDEVFQNLKESFSTDQQTKMLLELEDAWNSQKAFYLEYAYQQGLEDSVVLQDVLKKYEHLVRMT